MPMKLFALAGSTRRPALEPCCPAAARAGKGSTSLSVRRGGFDTAEEDFLLSLEERKGKPEQTGVAGGFSCAADSTVC
jgi:hypothetical protein